MGNGRSRGNNITSKSDRGTSETYTIARLKRDRPALAQKVISGEMSANAAAIEAGFRSARNTSAQHTHRATASATDPCNTLDTPGFRSARNTPPATKSKGQNDPLKRW